jgi:CBS domain-containing protein
MRHSETPPAEPQMVVEFLENTLPFSELDRPTLRWLARDCTVDFHPKGTKIFTQGVTEVDGLYLVQKGGVRLFVRDAEGHETPIDFRGEGGFLGATALFKDGLAQLDADTVEDTFFIKLGKESFLNLVKGYPEIAKYYLETISEDYLAKAFTELRRRKPEVIAGESNLFLFSRRIEELVKSPAIGTTFGKTIQEAAREMIRHKVGSLLIYDPSGEPAGIVTDTDLRKTVALGLDYHAPIETIMSTPVETIEIHQICFDALLRMMTRNIHHLAVLKEGKVASVVTSHDILVMQGKSPFSLFREITSQRTIEGLYPLSGKVPQVVRSMVEEGGRAGSITRIISIINDMILERLLDLLLKELGPPPLPFCWILMGSEGRREQTFATDQDNGLIYKGSEEEIINRAAEYYFAAFTEQAIGHLVKCGFPLCPGEIMASNPTWRKPLSLWKERFDGWIRVPEPKEVLHATIFFDFRSGYGKMELAEELRNFVTRHAGREDVFLRYLAQDCLETRPPLSFFKNIIVERDGEHKNTLDIKRRGLVPFMDFARVLALKNGIKETNTLDRLNLLAKGGHIPQLLSTEASEAFEFLLHVRLMHQLELIESERPPDNRIDPSVLSDLEKRTLKDAFGVIGSLQSFLKGMFRLNIA